MILSPGLKNPDVIFDSHFPDGCKGSSGCYRIFNEKSENLGYRFAALVEKYFAKIASVPTASSVRYRDVRCKPMLAFPYLIMYRIDEATETVQIL